MADTERMLEAPQKYLEALCNKDLEGVMALYADDATVEDPVGTDKHVGKAAVRKFYAGAVEAGVQAELTGPVRLAGQEAAFPFVIKIPAAGMEMDVIDVFRFNDEGLVVEMRAFWGDSNNRKV